MGVVKANPKDAIIRKQVQSIQFGFYSDTDVRERSVVEVTSPVAFDPNHTALPAGLYDARMGPVHSSEPPCATCAVSYHDCPGHSGHIELAVSVHHPLLLDEILTILRCKCLHCHNTRAPPRPVAVQAAKFKLLFSNQLDQYQDLDAKLASAMHEARDGSGTSEMSMSKAAATRAAASAMDRILNGILESGTTFSRNGNTNHLSTSYHKAQYATLCKETVQLLKSAARCHHCGAYSPKLRHDSSNKIFQIALSDKMRRMNASENITIQSALINATGTTTEQGQSSVKENAKDDYDSDDTDRDDDPMDMVDDEAAESDSDDGDDDEEGAKSVTKRDKYMHTAEIEAQFKRLWRNQPFLCHCLFGGGAPDVVSEDSHKKYFLQAIPVPPNRFRPPMHLNGMAVDHSQTGYLSKVLMQNTLVRDRFAASDEAAAYAAWIDLQTAVNCYMDSSKDPSGTGGTQVANGIRQILERKEGLFRKNMMGKRVDHACRSVISPDPYVGTNEIGLPRYFASVLTYPTPVTERNVAEMRKLVERGPHNYPAARWVEVAGKRRIDLSKMNAHKRQAVAAQLLVHLKKGGKPVMVGRQLRNGDYVLMNRQPTLHKPGIMAHRVRVLHNPTQKTIRMHYANCNTYNADFDGDEMNCHFPQNDLASAEAQYLPVVAEYAVELSRIPSGSLGSSHRCYVAMDLEKSLCYHALRS